MTPAATCVWAVALAGPPPQAVSRMKGAWASHERRRRGAGPGHWPLGGAGLGRLQRPAAITRPRLGACVLGDGGLPQDPAPIAGRSAWCLVGVAWGCPWASSATPPAAQASPCRHQLPVSDWLRGAAEGSRRSPGSSPIGELPPRRSLSRSVGQQLRAVAGGLLYSMRLHRRSVSLVR